MDALGWLFGGKGRAVNVTFTDNTVSIPALEFVGRSSKSPSGVYLLAWDSPPANAKSKVGHFLLLNHQRLVARGTLPRPMDGHVANNGTFVLVDAGRSKKLESTLTAYDYKGRLILKHIFSANVLHCAISEDGRSAVCDTARSNTEDSNIVATFDLKARRSIAQFSSELGWTDDYGFSPGGNLLSLRQRNLGTFHYTLDGTFIDRDKWRQACLRNGDYATTIPMVKVMLAEANGPARSRIAESLLKSLDRIAPDLASAATSWKVVYHQTRALCLEAMGDKAAATEAKDEAKAVSRKPAQRKRR